MEMIFCHRLINTLVLDGTSAVLALAVGVTLGVIVALRRGSRIDVALPTFSSTFYSMPVFRLDMIPLVVFAVMLNAFPVGGTTSATLEHREPLSLRRLSPAYDSVTHSAYAYTNRLQLSHSEKHVDRHPRRGLYSDSTY